MLPSAVGGFHGWISVSTPLRILSSSRVSPVVEKQLGVPSQPRSPSKVAGSALMLLSLIVRRDTPRSFGGVPRRLVLSA